MRGLVLWSLAALVDRGASQQCEGVVPPTRTCKALNITVENALDVPLEWSSPTCPHGSLLALDADGAMVRLPDEGDIFIAAHSRRHLFAFAEPGDAGCALSAVDGVVVLRLHGGSAAAIFNLFYITEQHPNPGWEAPKLGTSDFWGWNISSTANHWAGPDGVSRTTYVVAGCKHPPVPRHGMVPEKWATAESRGGLSCLGTACDEHFTQCCFSQAEYECDSHNHWQLKPSAEPSICLPDGRWSHPQTCTSECGLDPEDVHAVAEDSGYTVSYTCDRGFQLHGDRKHRSCPPGLACSHPQPGYQRRCDRTHQQWTIEGNATIGDVSNCPQQDEGCCTSSCGDWYDIFHGHNQPAADGKSTVYRCEPGFIMVSPDYEGTREDLVMNCSWSAQGWTFSPPDPPACRCKDEGALAVPRGWTHKKLGAATILIECDGQDAHNYVCSEGKLENVDEGQFCCTGTFETPVVYPQPCGSRSPFDWLGRPHAIGAIAIAVSLLCCCSCVYLRCTKQGRHRSTDLRASLINRSTGVGRLVSPGGQRTTGGIDQRLSFASQMQARVERAAEERSRREHHSGKKSSTRSVGSSLWDVEGGGTASSSRSMPDTSSSKRIAQFKGRNTPEMIPFESLQLMGKVGAGSSGVVFEGELKGTSVAVKRLNLILDAATLEQFLSEVHMLTKVTHPNVVLFFGVSFDDRDHDCYLVTEYCHRGNLQDYLETNPKMTRPLKLQMAVDVARGMNFLHQSEIIHRDLKSVSYSTNYRPFC